jgi:D-glucosaminate-6-phosphate ammonia-lyase
MSAYTELGLKPVINAAGTCVPLDRLQGAASTIIAEVTGAEAGYVTAGAAAGLTLSAAACIAGLDLARMDRLPDTSGLPTRVSWRSTDESIVCREQRNGYDHALRGAGARLVDVGMNEQVAGAGVRRTEAWEIEAALCKRTSGGRLLCDARQSPTAGGSRRRVSAARRQADRRCGGTTAPARNLHRFIDAGADLVTFSGGKGLRGPQSTGVLAGQRDLIMAVALQHLDL